MENKKEGDVKHTPKTKEKQNPQSEQHVQSDKDKFWQDYNEFLKAQAQQKAHLFWPNNITANYACEDEKTFKADLTQFEIELLCKFWAWELRGHDFLEHVTCDAQIGRGDTFFRLEYFKSIIGEEKVKKIIDDTFFGFEEEVAEHTEPPVHPSDE